MSFDKVNKRQNSIKQQLNKLKESTPCLECGQLHPYWRMFFDHSPGHKRVGSITSLVNEGASIEVINNEIAKCVLVCSNCYQDRKHYRRIGQYIREVPFIDNNDDNNGT